MGSDPLVGFVVAYVESGIDGGGDSSPSSGETASKPVVQDESHTSCMASTIERPSVALCGRCLYRLYFSSILRLSSV